MNFVLRELKVSLIKELVTKKWFHKATYWMWHIKSLLWEFLGLLQNFMIVPLFQPNNIMFIGTKTDVNICNFPISMFGSKFMFKWIWISCWNSNPNVGSQIGRCLVNMERWSFQIWSITSSISTYILDVDGSLGFETFS